MLKAAVTNMLKGVTNVLLTEIAEEVLREAAAAKSALAPTAPPDCAPQSVSSEPIVAAATSADGAADIVATLGLGLYNSDADSDSEAPKDVSSARDPSEAVQDGSSANDPSGAGDSELSTPRLPKMPLPPSFEVPEWAATESEPLPTARVMIRLVTVRDREPLHVALTSLFLISKLVIALDCESCYGPFLVMLMLLSCVPEDGSF